MADSHPNIDPLWDAILRDGLEDMHTLQSKKMSVREYGKLRGIQPQLVYYYIRTGQLQEEHCSECGRKVIDVVTTDRFFAERNVKKRAST